MPKHVSVSFALCMTVYACSKIGHNVQKPERQVVQLDKIVQNYKPKSYHVHDVSKHNYLCRFWRPSWIGGHFVEHNHLGINYIGRQKLSVEEFQKVCECALSLLIKHMIWEKKLTWWILNQKGEGDKWKLDNKDAFVESHRYLNFSSCNIVRLATLTPVSFSVKFSRKCSEYFLGNCS